MGREFYVVIERDEDASFGVAIPKDGALISC